MISGNIGILNQRIFPASGLQYYWRFDEGTGTNVADAMGNLNGTLTNASAWTTSGKNKNGLKPTSQYFKTSGTWTVWNTSQPYTISAWVKLNYGEANTIIQILTNIINASVRCIVDPYIYNSNGNVEFAIMNGTYRCRVQKLGLVTDSNWHNLVFQYNGDRNANNMKIYKDSVSQTLTVVTNSLNAGTWGNTYMVVGARDTVTYATTGIVDEVGLWNRVLTQEEVTALYNLGTGLFY